MPHKFKECFPRVPDCLVSVSEAPAEEAKPKKFVSYEEYNKTYKTDEQKKEEVRETDNFMQILTVLLMHSHGYPITYTHLVHILMKYILNSAASMGYDMLDYHKST